MTLQSIGIEGKIEDFMIESNKIGTFRLDFSIYINMKSFCMYIIHMNLHSHQCKISKANSILSIFQIN